MVNDWYEEDLEINNLDETELKLRCLDRDYEAMYLLAKYYLKSDNADEDIRVTIKLLETASNNGLFEAATLLGHIYKYGYNCDILPDEDIKNAIIWYKKAVAQNDPEAMYELGTIYLEPHDEDEFKAAEGLELVLNSAEQGYKLAQYSMGLLYLEGYYVPYNNKEALTWLEKSANNNCIESLLLLGKLYIQGSEVEQDYNEAYKYIKKAADLKSDDGMFLLGMCYDEAIGVEHDSHEALKWLNRAAEFDNVHALFAVGSHYEKGDGCKQSYSKAIEFYNLAADLGYPDAIKHLGYLYHVGHGVNKDLKKAFKLFNTASNLGDEEATHFVYICYRDGLGVSKDEKKALKYLKKGAKLDCPESLFELALAYFQGNYGLKINENKCIDCLIRAAELGLKEAEDILEELKK